MLLGESCGNLGKRGDLWAMANVCMAFPTRGTIHIGRDDFDNSGKARALFTFPPKKKGRENKLYKLEAFRNSGLSVKTSYQGAGRKSGGHAKGFG